MKASSSDRITRALEAAQSGKRAAVNALFQAVYDELKNLAARYLNKERVDHTLQPTALVNEAYVQMVDQTRVHWQGRAHFFAVAAQAMRRILVDHARKHKAAKRGGGRQRITLDEELIAGSRPDHDVLILDEALEKLAELDPRQARMVELRFFGGLSVAEVAVVLDMSKRTVEREWTMIRSWLRREFDQAS